MSEVPVPERSTATWSAGKPPAMPPPAGARIPAQASPPEDRDGESVGSGSESGQRGDEVRGGGGEEDAATAPEESPHTPEPSAPTPEETPHAPEETPPAPEELPRTPEGLIARHQRGVWRYLRMLGCDVATADDLTQETFLRVLRRESFVQHNDTATAGYLRRTAYNLLVSRHRKLGRMHHCSDAGALDEQWDRWAGKDASGDLAVDALKECLGALSERARMALRMRFDDESSRVEIGDALGITEHGARNLMQRAKKQLRRCVEEKLRQAES